MSAKDCLRGKGASGLVNKQKADETADFIESLEEEYRGSMGPAASSQADADALIAVRRRIKEKKRQRLKLIKAQTDVMNVAKAHKGRVAEAMLAHLSMDTTGRFGVRSVGTMRDVIRGRAHSIMVDFLSEFRPKMAGFRRRTAGLENMVREMFGERTGDAEAATFAKAAGEAMEYLRREFNLSGGAIPKRADWGLPQHHDRRLVAAIPRDEWVDFVAPRLDRAKMVDLDTGLPMSDAKLTRSLRDVYKTIVTGGAADVAPGEQIFRKGIAARRQEHRFLVFDSADKWLEYQERFGGRDAFNIVLGHIDAMARDTALMNVMGPNPRSTLRFMETLIDKDQGEAALEGVGRQAARAAERIGGSKTALIDTYNSVSGSLEGSPSPGIADFLKGNRNILSSAMLGSSFLIAISDTAFGRVTSKLNGLPAWKVLANQLKLMSPTNLADQRQAIRLGFTAQGWSDRALAAQRYIGEVVGPEWTGRVADSILRLSLLSPWTQSGRWAFMSEFAGLLTEMAERSFDNLPDTLKASFARHGITQDAWDLYRNTAKWKDPETGAEFIRPMDMITGFDQTALDTPLFGRTRDAADNIQSMIFDEAEFAVPSVTDRVRALTTAGRQAGTLWGEVARNALLFKSFPITILHTHMMRGATLNGGANKAKYFAHLFLATAVMGTMGQQLKEISAGRDPANMDPATEEGRKFVMKGLMAGGGLGLFGDFLFSDMNRYGGGIASTLAGPVFGSQLPALGKLTAGNLQELLTEGEAKNAGRELVRFVELMTPGRSLWYSRLATERLIFDELQKLVDPEASRSFQAIENRAKSEMKQHYFSRPGRGGVSKLPDLPAAIGIRRAPNLEEVFGG